MKLKEEFVTVFNDEESITVSVDTKLFSGMIKSNETAAFIIKCLEEETTKEDIVQKIGKEYDVPGTVVQADVTKIIDELRSIGALDE